jgi:hypothetical protein
VTLDPDESIMHTTENWQGALQNLLNGLCNDNNSAEDNRVVLQDYRLRRDVLLLALEARLNLFASGTLGFTVEKQNELAQFITALNTLVREQSVLILEVQRVLGTLVTAGSSQFVTSVRSVSIAKWNARIITQRPRGVVRETPRSVVFVEIYNAYVDTFRACVAAMEQPVQDQLGGFATVAQLVVQFAVGMINVCGQQP